MAPYLDSKPLSPHLTVYRFTWLMASSIIHRITGVALYFGLAVVVLWFVCLLWSEDAYIAFQRYAFSWPGLIILVGYTWALMQHLLGGLRHLIWDTGRALGVPQAKALAIAGFFGSLLLTALIWYYAGAFAP